MMKQIGCQLDIRVNSKNTHSETFHVKHDWSILLKSNPLVKLLNYNNKSITIKTANQHDLLRQIELKKL